VVVAAGGAVDFWRGEESGRFAIPHPLQKTQRVGHPELWRSDAVRLLGDYGFGFDFYAPLGVEESGYDHGGGGADGSEDFSVGAAYFFPVFGTGEEHASADYVLECGTGLGEGGFDELEDGAGLFGG